MKAMALGVLLTALAGGCGGPRLTGEAAKVGMPLYPGAKLRTSSSLPRPGSPPRLRQAKVLLTTTDSVEKVKAFYRRQCHIAQQAPVAGTMEPFGEKGNKMSTVTRLEVTPDESARMIFIGTDAKTGQTVIYLQMVSREGDSELFLEHP